MTEHQQNIVLSFLDFVGESGQLEAEQLEIVSSVLKEGFKVPADKKTTVRMLDVFPAAAQEEEPVFDEAKWEEFLEVIKGKGYFNGCEEGSTEYAERLEKAKKKFIARNNPYEGLSADQLKAKGNELMQKGQHKNAVGFYSKAIELDATNPVYFSNRAAAYTQLNQFRDAVRDCERATQLKDDYSKAWSRLGTAHFYLNNYPASVEAFKKACELEPENAAYKQDLLSAEQKAAAGPAMPGMPGGFDLGAMGQMMQNPQFMEMANNMMQNPAFQQMATNMMKSMGGPDGMDPSKIAEVWGQGGVGQMPGAEGEHGDTIPTPFGPMSREALEKLRESHGLQDNPKMQQLREEMQREGPMAIMKHMNDPEVQAAMNDFSQMMAKGAAKPEGEQ